MTQGQTRRSCSWARSHH